MCVLFIVVYLLLLFGVIGRLCSLIVGFPEHFLHYFDDFEILFTDVHISNFELTKYHYSIREKYLSKYPRENNGILSLRSSHTTNPNRLIRTFPF